MALRMIVGKRSVVAAAAAAAAAVAVAHAVVDWELVHLSTRYCSP